MVFLRGLEWAFGCFILAYVSWQIVCPLLRGKKPFTKTTNRKDK
jgi:hypothetical protein